VDTRAGELASKIATDVISLTNRKPTPIKRASRGPALRGSQRQSSDPRPWQASPEFRGMGTDCHDPRRCCPTGALPGPRWRQPGPTAVPRQLYRAVDLRPQLTSGKLQAVRSIARGRKSRLHLKEQPSPDRSALTRPNRLTWKARIRFRWAIRSCCAATACRTK